MIRQRGKQLRNQLRIFGNAMLLADQEKPCSLALRHEALPGRPGENAVVEIEPQPMLDRDCRYLLLDWSLRGFFGEAGTAYQERGKRQRVTCMDHR